MARYLISFPSAAMAVSEGEWEAVGRDAHAVTDEAKAGGVYVFCGGFDEGVPTVLVASDGAVAEGGIEMAQKVRPNDSFKPYPATSCCLESCCSDCEPSGVGYLAHELSRANQDVNHE